MGGLIIIYILENEKHIYSSYCNYITDAINKFKKDNKNILNIMSKNIEIYNSNGIYVKTIILKL
ncbi:MAG TPA: hypothetical protein PLM63_00235 [bacterium]|nr:hypothetical protein [bacterium]HQL11936.1 hypothetical protein [bacterium]